MPVDNPVLVVKDPVIAAYGFGHDHPFGPDRHDAFHARLASSGVADQVEFIAAREASREELLSYHTERYVDYVCETCDGGGAMLDAQDTPALDNTRFASSR